VSVWTRMAEWFGFGERRFADLSSFIAAAGQAGGNYGARVAPETAARKVAVGSSIRLVSNTARTMPAHAFTGDGATTRQLPDPPLLINPDGTDRGIADLIAQAAWSVAARGNLMVQILTRTSHGLPDTVQVLNPDLLRPELDTDGSLWWRVLANPYQHTSSVRLPSRDVIHRRMYPIPGFVLGLSPIEQHAATIGMGISAEKFGADFFDSGGHPTALLKSVAPMTEPQAKTVKQKFRIAASSREPVLLPDGITYEQIQVNPEESQFLEAQGYSSAECCRIFGPGFAEALGYETGGTMTYANVVDSDLKLLKYSLNPFLVPIEEVLTACLPKGQYVKLNRESLLQMNPLDRFKLYEIAARIGLQTPNDQLALEDKPPVAWGDKPYFVPATTLQAEQPAQKQTGATQ
jgi:HK97 family phage portal protein